MSSDAPPSVEEDEGATHLYGVGTELTADSVEFCPHPARAHLFVCGNYELDEATRVKEGRIALCALTQEGDAFEERQRLKTEAVFDLKWCEEELEQPLLGQVDADGLLALYALEGEERLGRVASASAGEGISTLSLDWRRRARVAVSQTDGGLSLWAVRPGAAAPEIEQQWKAHELEAWIVASDRWQEGVYYSGADDCQFRAWDARVDCGSGPLATATDRRAHGAGVTTIASSPHREHTLATGSYDDRVRVWDTRALRRGPLREIDTGGGVWRLRWHPDPALAGVLLTGSMRGGFRVLRDSPAPGGGDEAGGRLTQIVHYRRHGSLAYGCDWCRAPGRGTLVASCSFYDRRLHLWRAKVDPP